MAKCTTYTTDAARSHHAAVVIDGCATAEQQFQTLVHEAHFSKKACRVELWTGDNGKWTGGEMTASADFCHYTKTERLLIAGAGLLSALGAGIYLFVSR